MGKLSVLLDTHIFLWWLFDDPRLSQGIRERIANTENDIYVSAASVWEIATKYRLGKLPQAKSVARNVPAWVEKAGFKALAISADHAQLSGSWNVPHRDPFDRMLAAQSRKEKMPLISVDGALKQFGIELVGE